MHNKDNIIIGYLIAFLVILVATFTIVLVGHLRDEGITVSSVLNSNKKPDIYEVTISGDTYDEQCESAVKCLTENYKFTTFEKYHIIHDWVASYVSYDYEALKPGNTDLLIIDNDPEHVLDTGWGVCGGYARLYEDLCNTARLNCKYVSGKADFLGQSKIGHAWNVVEMDGKLYHMDVCWDDANDLNTRYEWFMQGNNYVTNSFRSWEQDYDISDASYILNRNNMEQYKFRTTKE